MKLFGFEIGNFPKQGKEKSNTPTPNSPSDNGNSDSAPQRRKKIVTEATLAKRKEGMLKSRDDLPYHEELANASNSPFDITHREKQELAVLLTNKVERECFIIVSNRRISIPMDNAVDRISGVARYNNWKVIGKKYIEHSLIKDIYLADERSKEARADRSDIEKEFDEIVKYACDNNISDVHIEVTENSAVIRVRRNSLLEDFHHLGIDYAVDFCTVVYQVLSETESKDISFLPRRQQSSVIERRINGHGTIRIRLNTIPTAPSGFDMVLRILKSGGGAKLTLSQLGYNNSLIRSLEIASAKPVGALIVAGTTGSGKSTTLKTLLEDKVAQFDTPNGCAIKIITVEDPPEYDIKGVSQCNVSTSKAGGDEGQSKNPFGDAIKAAMRCDPDVLMAGEVRDEDSAELLMHITLSGHQVMTTIHASSAISIIARLRNNGIPNDALGNSDFLSGLVYQKLVPKACPKCSHDLDHYKKITDNPKDEELFERISSVIPTEKQDFIRFRNVNGCPECKAGVVGQTVIAEVILPDHKMLEYFLSGEDTKAWHHHKKMGGKTIIDHAHEKIMDSTCDPRDVENKIGLLTMDLVMEGGFVELNDKDIPKGSALDNSVKFVEFITLNDVSKAKVTRAEKLIASKVANNEITGKGFSKDFYATILEHPDADLQSLLSASLEAGLSIQADEIVAVIGELKNILR